jgi:hypothetical protein
MKTAQSLLGKWGHSYIGLDGTKVSSKDMEYYAFECLPDGLAAWLVPKASRMKLYVF